MLVNKRSSKSLEEAANKILAARQKIEVSAESFLEDYLGPCKNFNAWLTGAS